MTSSPEQHRLELHQTVHDSFVDRAEFALSRGHVDKAATLLTIAVDVASRNHIGRFTDDRVEYLAARLAASVAGSCPVSVVPEDAVADVVHVVGEHPTRRVDSTIERWMKCGVGRSRVVTTGRRSEPLRERAATLRTELHHATTVVVHTEPDDLTPLLALGGWARPPVVFVNHSDTVFWPGVSTFDLIASHRAVGSALAVDRRCVSVGRTVLLPPFAADDESWSRALVVIEQRVHEVTPALPPPPSLPRPFEPRDADLARQLDVAGRSDGLVGALQRHRRVLDVADRPELSVVVLASDPDATVECLHRALDAWTISGTVQLIVVDLCGGREMSGVLDELTGTVLAVRASDADPFSAVAAGLKWAWGQYAAIITDSATPMVGGCAAAMATLNDEAPRSVAPIAGLSENEPSGVLVQIDASEHDVEHVFAQVSRHMVWPDLARADARVLDLVHRCTCTRWSLISVAERGTPCCRPGSQLGCPSGSGGFRCGVVVCGRGAGDARSAVWAHVTSSLRAHGYEVVAFDPRSPERSGLVRGDVVSSLRKLLIEQRPHLLVHIPTPGDLSPADVRQMSAASETVAIALHTGTSFPEAPTRVADASDHLRDYDLVTVPDRWSAAELAAVGGYRLFCVEPGAHAPSLDEAVPGENDTTVVDDGCGCHVVGSSPASSRWALLGLLGFAAAARRRRRR